MMKNLIFLIFAVSVILTACSKEKVGCREETAVNYRPDADTDGPCNYTKVIFYTASNKLGGIGVPIDSIRLVDFDFGGTGEETTLTTLTTFNHTPPSNCEGDPESFIWELKDGNKFWVVYYYFNDGVINRRLGEWLEPDASTQCIEKKLTL